MKKMISFMLIIIISPFLLCQNDPRVDNHFNLNINNDFKNGEILSSNNGRLKGYSELYKSNRIADPYMIGIFSTLTANSIITEGIVLVKTSKSDNSIKADDFITSNSDGSAIKINGKGWCLGVAIEDESNGFVLTRLYIHYKD